MAFLSCRVCAVIGVDVCFSDTVFVVVVVEGAGVAAAVVVGFSMLESQFFAVRCSSRGCSLSDNS